MAKKKTRAKKTVTVADPKARSQEEIQRVRNKVTNAILDGSVDMATRMVQSVSEGGQITALKFLWETVGLFPGDGAGGAEESDSLARILLQRMGLKTDIPAEGGNGEGDVESEEDLAED